MNHGPLLALLFCASPIATAAAQEARGWGPEQACGAPDTPRAGDHASAWASRSEDGGPEWIVLEFAREVVPTAVRVFESFNPGAVVAVLAVDDAGTEIELWRGLDPVAPGAEHAVTLIPLAGEHASRRIKLELDSQRVRGWNEIDAVGLHGPDGALQWAVLAEASSTFARGPARSPSAVDAGAPLPVDQWASEHPTSVDGLFRLWLELAGNDGVPEAVRASLAREIVQVQRGLVDASERGFGGRWSTTYGLMTLRVDGERVSGSYPLGAIEGTLADGRLEFTYTEADVSGSGWFELDPSQRSFSGRWQPDGSERWRRWSGERVAQSDERAWLVVLEAPWQSSMFDAEFSFGGMLSAIFDHNAGVSVRQRFFTDAQSFEAYCREAALLPGRVVMVVATHADPSGLSCQAGKIPPQQVAAALAAVPNLQMVHFSACAVMAGDMPEQIFAARPADDALEVVSGYGVSVDWMGSALTEFTLMDLVLNRGLAPGEAARQLTRILDFADGEVVESSPIPPSHFRFLERSGEQ